MSDPTNPNPYQAPQAPVGVSTDPSALPLASPWIRLGAVIIDGIVLAPINFILQKILLHIPGPTEQYEAAQKGGAAAVEALMPGKGMLLLSQILGVAVLIGVNFVFLKQGQTIGKKVLKLQIRNRTDNSILPLQDLILKRILPVYIVTALAVAIHYSIGLLLTIDALCIFRAGRNTLHDDIANTKVVKLPG